ncbi:WhiB family transcriptional regulator [Streptomyces sp. NPDC055709]
MPPASAPALDTGRGDVVRPEAGGFPQRRNLETPVERSLTPATSHSEARQPSAWDRHWRQRGACTGKDTNLFFAEHRSSGQEEALRICESCPVRTECLAYALDERFPYGIFGGTTPTWRRDLLRRRPHITSWRGLLYRAKAEFMNRPHNSGPNVAANRPRRTSQTPGGTQNSPPSRH